MPVLRTDLSRIGTDPRPRRAPLARGPFIVGKSRGVLLQLQQQQRRPDPRRGRFQIGTPPAPLYAPHFSPAHAPHRPSRRALAQIPVLLNYFSALTAGKFHKNRPLAPAAQPL